MVALFKNTSPKNNFYLLLGDDFEKKSARIELIKAPIKGSKSEQFNYDLLHAEGLKPQRLKESLNSLPVQAKNRVIVIKEPEDLSKENQELILNYFKKPLPTNILIFDCRQSYIKKDKFLVELSGFCETDSSFQKNKLSNSFGFYDAITRGDSKAALSILSELLLSDNKPQMIMGSIIGQFANSSYRNKQKIYDEILSADVAIKTGRVKPKLGLEILTVRLSAGFKKPLR